MGRGRIKKKQRKGPGTAPAEKDAPASVRAHLARGRTKQALREANAWRKVSPGAAADALLIEAAQARMDQLAATGQFAAAKELATSMGQRFPGALRNAEILQLRSDLRRGCPEAALAELARPTLEPRRRQALLDLLVEEIRDPRDVAYSDALPEDHPLRREAAAVARALEAATSGSVDLGSLARETNVASASPFAPWKLLALGIEAAYQGDPATVERVARQMPAHARPAFLLPALRAMAARTSPTETTPEVQRILSAVDDGSAAASRDLKRLAEAVCEGDDTLAFPLVRSLARWFDAAAPALRSEFDRLLHRAWADAGGDLPRVENYLARLGSRASSRNQALAMEALGDRLAAIEAWEDYLRFAGGSPIGVSLVRQRQAQLAARERLLDEAASDCDCPLCRMKGLLGVWVTDGTDPAVPRPRTYLEKALEAHPSPEAWQALVQELETSGSPQEVGAAVTAWHEAFPEDVEPVLRLLRAAERRGAIRKALRLLETAEVLGPTHPEVREGRFRLLLEGARRRLRQGKHKLAMDDVQALGRLPRASDPSADVLIRTLGVLAALVGSRPAEAEPMRRALISAVGEPGAALALAEAAAWVGLSPAALAAMGVSLPVVPSVVEASEASRAVAGVERVFSRVGWAVTGGGTWSQELLVAVEGGFAPTARDLEPLCRWAMRREAFHLLYHLSALGLRSEGTRRHRFLLDRAHSLQGLGGDVEREAACRRAAQVLAQQVNDTTFAAEVRRESHPEESWSMLEALSGSPASRLMQGPHELDTETAARVLRDEAAQGLDSVVRPRSRGRRGRRTQPRKGVGARVRAAMGSFLPLFHPDEDAQEEETTP